MRIHLVKVHYSMLLKILDHYIFHSLVKFVQIIAGHVQQFFDSSRKPNVPFLFAFMFGTGRIRRYDEEIALLAIAVAALHSQLLYRSY